ncbi:unnamed protein product [Calicophoron daubneyi]|uniref:Tegument antigen n=1 Tax=Calicophoron daubneyi TaxID=300641 RepID=A0AAV2TQJ7_CALDB
MDGFVEAFYEIDKSRKEWISIEQLEEYMKANELDETFVQRWKSLFDPEGTGRIKLVKFCQVLGLEVKRVRRQFNAGKSEDVEIIDTDMTEAKRVTVSATVREGLNQFPEDDLSLVKWIKKRMDQQFERTWNVIIIQGRYNSFYSHETGTNMCFRMGDRIFLIYKTPDPTGSL